VNVTIRAVRLPTGVYPARREAQAIAVIREAYPAVHGCGDALSGALMNAGPVIHPPLMVMNAAPLQHFERWVRGRLAKGFSLEDAARSVGASERTLERRIRLILGRSPLSYVQDLRVERAVHLLRTTNKSVEAIASLVGYAGGVTLRTLLRRKLGKGVKEIRRFQ